MLKSGLKKILTNENLIQCLISPQNRGNMYFVNVPPKKVSHISLINENSSCFTGSGSIYGLYNGLFDLFKIPFSKHFMYRTVKQMLEGEEWTETPYFKKLSQNNHNKNNIIHLKKLNRIINYINEDGYLSQYELDNLSQTISISDFKIPIHETLLAIDRFGRLFRIKGGRHRLAVAQLLDVQEMPAIITLVHTKAVDKLPSKARKITGSLEDFRPF